MSGYLNVNNMFNLTIITACWRAENLPKVIESISNQTYKGEIEHILVNDNNPEVREWFKHNNYFVNNPHRHVIDSYVRGHYYGAIARNIGIMMAFSYIKEKERDIDNEYICFHDDDNLWKTEHLQSMVDTLKDNSEATLVASDAEWRGYNDKNWVAIRPCLLKQDGCDLGQFMWKANLFKKYGVFDAHPHSKQRYDFRLIKKIVDSEGEEKVAFTRNSSFIMSYRKK